MGAATFMTFSKGETAEKAFYNAIDEAHASEGTGGYTGTIAEKEDFIKIDLPPGKNSTKYASELLANGDPRIFDKWGPAGCIQAGTNEYIFFGWASY